jgi:hypothetical protein
MTPSQSPQTQPSAPDATSLLLTETCFRQRHKTSRTLEIQTCTEKKVKRDT